MDHTTKTAFARFAFPKVDPARAARAAEAMAKLHERQAAAFKLWSEAGRSAAEVRTADAADILDMVENDKLSEGHARALLGAGSPSAVERLARTAQAKGWSVRELEKRVREDGQGKAGKASAAAEGPEKSANVKDLEKRYSHALGVTVSIEQGKGERGRICLEYASYDELDRLLGLLVR